jgi:REP element-mobilizing transposase RayT
LFRVGGPATKTDARQSLAHRSHDAEARRAAKAALARPPVIFDGTQARAIARGFRNYCTTNPRPVHALAILPDHAHLVIGRTGLRIERIANLLKGAATTRLKAEGLHPFADQPYGNGRLPSPWAAKDWHVFLDSPAAIRRAIRYVELNPVRAGRRRQVYRWVTPYGG